MKFFRRILLHIVAIALMSLGVTLMLKANQGAFAYDGISYYVHYIINIPTVFTIGVSSWILGVSWTILNFFLTKDRKTLLSLLIVFTFGLFIDFWFDFVLGGYSVSNMFLNILIALGGLLLLGLGASITIFNKRFPINPSEVFMMHITKYTKKTFISKLYIELGLLVIFLILAWVANEGFSQVGWFTFVSMIILGPIIGFFESILKRFIDVY